MSKMTELDRVEERLTERLDRIEQLLPTQATPTKQTPPPVLEPGETIYVSYTSKGRWLAHPTLTQEALDSMSKATEPAQSSTE